MIFHLFIISSAVQIYEFSYSHYQYTVMHRLPFLLTLPYGLHFVITFHCTWKDFLASFSVLMCLDSSVSFLLLVRRNELMCFLYLSLYDSVVVVKLSLSFGRPRLFVDIFLHFPFPLKRKCLQTNVADQATVTIATTTESYIGLATNRYGNHMSSFRRTNRRNETELSKHIWTLKDCQKILPRAMESDQKCKPYDNVSKKCNLCLQEKIFIICRRDLCTLNKRNELASSCPHRNRFTLRNVRIT